MADARKGRARREAILALARPHARGVVVDVGCDHGIIAAALGAIGVERRSRRLPARGDVPLVVADGLKPFARVDLAVICGMGPSAILEILAAGPRPAAAVAHSPQHAASLRRGLAAAGWRIDAERLAPEGGRYAEVMRLLPGEEAAEGYELAFGPRLLDGGDPHLLAHARQLRGWHAGLATSVPPSAPIASSSAGWVAWLDALIERLEG